MITGHWLLDFRAYPVVRLPDIVELSGISVLLDEKNYRENMPAFQRPSPLGFMAASQRPRTSDADGSSNQLPDIVRHWPRNDWRLPIALAISIFDGIRTRYLLLTFSHHSLLVSAALPMSYEEWGWLVLMPFF